MCRVHFLPQKTFAKQKYFKSSIMLVHPRPQAHALFCQLLFSKSKLTDVVIVLYVLWSPLNMRSINEFMGVKFTGYICCCIMSVHTNILLVSLMLYQHCENVLISLKFNICIIVILTCFITEVVKGLFKQVFDLFYVQVYLRCEHKSIWTRCPGVSNEESTSSSRV